MLRRGRPASSQIRQNIVELLAVLGTAHGYQINKIYQEIFPSCTREIIYYHLKKGVALGEFVIEEVKLEKGEFSWGSVAEKVYYKLGPSAKPKGDERVKRYFEQLRRA
ncbi:MAG: hypothetical protein QXU88_00415 [Candidatus Woesearchaeota archaeon]